MEQILKEKGFQLQNESMITIEKLVHIASMGQNWEVEDILGDMEYSDFVRIIPSLTAVEFDSYDDTRYDLLYDYDKFGFLAKCYFNVPTNISFREDGSCKSYFSSNSYRELYLYGDTMEELLDHALKIEKELFEKELEKARRF